MAANPNNFNYWLRNGSVLPPYTLGNVAGTARFDYFERNGTIMFPAAIQPSGTYTKGNFFLLFDV